MHFLRQESVGQLPISFSSTAPPPLGVLDVLGKIGHHPLDFVEIVGFDGTHPSAVASWSKDRRDREMVALSSFPVSAVKNSIRPPEPPKPPDPPDTNSIPPPWLFIPTIYHR